MDEHLTSSPREPSGRPEPASRLRPGRRAAVGAVIALVLAAGIIAWVVLANRDNSSPAGPVSTKITPVALSASGLRTLAGSVGQPIYWAGPKKGYMYELHRTTNNSVYVRYLPLGVQAGAAEGKYTIVGTYPFVGAFSSLMKVAKGDGVQISGGGLALVDKSHPNSVHIAFPNVDYQVEVYDPSPAHAFAVASSGKVQTVG